MGRLALGISYCGTDYYGWQKQKHSNNTVQYHVESALSQVANCTLEVVCAGRTDSGVHGTGQVIHLTTAAKRSLRGWVMGANTHLPANIRVNWAKTVTDDFHARFSATYRRYQYIISDSSQGNAIFDGLITPCRYKLDVETMHQSAQCLLGEQDFTSFQAAQCQSKTAFRCIDFINVYRNKNFIIIDIRANAFLYHMVRNITGALIAVGRGKQSVSWLHEVLMAKDRKQSAATAPASGLYLVEVGYDSVYNIPIGSETLPFLLP